MVWQLTLYSVPPLLAALLSLGLLWVTRDRYDSSDSLVLVFGLLMSVLFAWSLTTAIQIGFQAKGAKLLWSKLGSTFGATVPLIWIALTLLYAGRDEWVSKRVFGVLGLEVAFYIVLVWTNEGHRLIVPEQTLVTTQYGPVLDQSVGTALAIHLVIAYLLVLAGIGLLVQVALRSSRVYRKQATLLVVGAVVPLAANVASVLGVSPIPYLDLTTFTFTLTGLCFGLALFRFDLLDLTPVARERMIEGMGDGLLVFDLSEKLRDFNRPAERILDADLEVGAPASNVFGGELSAVDGTTVTATIDGREYFYDIRIESLYDHRGSLVGHVVALRDVTAQKAYEQRLEVTNRLLRHNLRNDMTVITANAEHLADTLDGEQRSIAEMIIDTAEDVGRLSRKAQTIEQTVDYRDRAPIGVPAADIVEGIVESASRNDEATTVSLERPTAAPAKVIDEDLFGVAVENLIDNAIRHNDTDEPQVDVIVETEDGMVSVTVADNGPGIPDAEREPLEKGEETALEHGSGLGLWLVKWVVDGTEGSLHFTDNEPRGAKVTITFPAAEETDVGSSIVDGWQPNQFST